MKQKFDNILGTVGNTPVVRINRLAPPDINLFVKIEAFNPLGSVKDRLALGVIEDAEKTGKLKPGQTVIEATSGNTGIGLAMVCAQKGYPLVVTMAETFKDHDEDAEEYADYHTIQGLPTALTITRYHNGDMTNQRYLTKVTYGAPLDPGLFDPAVALKKVK